MSTGALRGQAAGVIRDAARLHSHRRLLYPVLALVLVLLLAGAGYRWFHERVATTLPFVPALDLYALLVDATPLPITVAAGGQLAPATATATDIRSNVVLWRRMHLANWNTVEAPLRTQGLDAMLTRYRDVLMNPSTWDRMRPKDWDRVPQPVRTVAYREMVAYWAGFYDVGGKFGLLPGVVSDTLAAVMISESWFDHRAVQMDRTGNRDVGLAQASDFARSRLRELHRLGVVDVFLDDEDYFNPWSATRFLALWMKLMLDEAHGDLDLAVRAYNRGLAEALDDRGSAYLDAVHRRLRRFIQNRDAPPAWNYVWRRGRMFELQDWPWIAAAR